jgi:tRNA(Ile)-lysidine synthase
MIEWDGFEVRRFRGLLYVTPALLEFSAGAMRWDWQQPLVLAGEMGTLRAERTTGRGLRLADLPQRLDVEFRRSGDSLRPAGCAHRRSLKKLFQEAGVLPWWRERLPMIRIDGVLAAVGDLWVADEFAARHGEEGIDILWDERPQIRTYSPASTN